jgi:hypothetical protein
MIRRLIPMTALMLLLAGHIEHSALAQTAGEDSYSAAMKVWEKSENILVSAQAQNLIVSGFYEFSGELTEFGGNIRWKNGTRTLNETLVTYYLSDLRDLKVAKNLGRSAIPFPLGQVPGAKSSQGVTTELRPSMIGVPDVEAYPVKEFITKNRSVLKGKKGELHTVSRPSGASIVLDNVRKKGFTEKITVEYAGEHPIRVDGQGVQCSDKVTVPDGGTVTFHCP